MASEIKVDTISEKTSANGVTIDSVSLKDGKVATANSIDSDAYVDGSIDTAHIADDQITLAKMASGTDGNIISYDASGNPVAIATGSDGQVLTSTGAGSPPAFEAGGGAWNLISTFTSDGSDATASITSGIDSTYDVYCFMYTNIHPETDSSNLQFNGSIDGGSNYNVSKVTTFFKTTHNEADSSYALGYDNGTDIVGTGFANLNENTGSDADQTASGYLYLFGPSSTTYQKHWHAVTNTLQAGDQLQQSFVSGFFNTTSAINAVQFKQASGEIQGGKIKLYGIS